MIVQYSPHFTRLYKKLTFELRRDAKVKEKVFRADPFDPRLKTHKLSGRLEGLYAFSISHSHRIIFEFVKNDLARFHEIGTHDIYE